jgi:acetoacetate decarboxylase
MTNSRSGRPLPFHRREFLVITYETDAELIRAQLTEPLEPIDRPLAHYEYVWIKMPDSSGFGSYTELDLVIPACRSATWSGRMTTSVSEVRIISGRLGPLLKVHRLCRLRCLAFSD